MRGPGPASTHSRNRPCLSTADLRITQQHPDLFGKVPPIHQISAGFVLPELRNSRQWTWSVTYVSKRFEGCCLCRSTLSGFTKYVVLWLSFLFSWKCLNCNKKASCSTEKNIGLSMNLLLKIVFFLFLLFFFLQIFNQCRLAIQVV